MSGVTPTAQSVREAFHSDGMRRCRRRMVEPSYKAIPEGSNGLWSVVNLNGRGRLHGVEIVADRLPSREEADAWIAKAEGRDV